MIAIACALAFWGALAFAGFVLWLRAGPLAQRTAAERAEMDETLARMHDHINELREREIKASATAVPVQRVDVVAETLQQVAGRVERIERAMDL